MSVLQQRDKTLNYCESCKHRQTQDSFNYHCGLTAPDFDFLPENGCANMIKNGVDSGIRRVEK